MYFLDGHTRRDYDELIAAGIDPSTTQPREHTVPCKTCGWQTVNQAGGCDNHYRAPFAVTNKARQEALFNGSSH